MALLFAVMLTTAAGNTAMQSVMPSIGTELGVNDVWISLAYSWSALLWVICAPVWAERSDRRGRKAMMALGLSGFIASFVLCGLMLWLGLSGVLTAFWALLLFAVARSLYGGFGSAAPPAVQAYVASRTPRAERTQALSLIASSFGLGTVIGPALAPLMVLPFVGLTGPFIVFALIGIVTLAMLRLRLPNDEPQFAARGEAYDAPYAGGTTTARRDEDADPGADEEEEEDDGPAEPGKLRWFEPRLRPWVIAGLLGGHAQAMVLGIAGFLVLDRLGLRDDPTAGAGPVGLVLMAGAIATLLAQWGLIPAARPGAARGLALGHRDRRGGNGHSRRGAGSPRDRARLFDRLARLRPVPPRQHRGNLARGEPRRTGTGFGHRRLGGGSELHLRARARRLALRPFRLARLRTDRDALPGGVLFRLDLAPARPAADQRAALEDFEHAILRAAQSHALVGLDQRPLDQDRIRRHRRQHAIRIGIGKVALDGIGAAQPQALVRRDSRLAIELR